MGLWEYLVNFKRGNEYLKNVIGMKIVTWNANGRFVKNFETILKEDENSKDADIYIIQECTNPSVSNSEDYAELGSKYYWVDWVGDDEKPEYGLGIIAKKETVEMKVWDLDDKGLRYFIPVTVNDDFNLLAVWTNIDKGESNAKYPKLITNYYEEHKDSGFFNEDMIICGDFNCDKRAENKYHGENVDEMIDKLSEINLVDVYHDIEGEEEGKESIPTHIWRYEKPFHLDHVFAAKGKVNCLQIGNAKKWIVYSDHMPIVFKI